MPTHPNERSPRKSQDAEVASFANTMPREYRQRHHPNAIWHHSKISTERTSAVNVGTFSPGGLTTGFPLCVVADDRPGLLARVCIGLEALNLDVRDAEAYLRRRLDGRVEAVDLVWSMEMVLVGVVLVIGVVSGSCGGELRRYRHEPGGAGRGPTNALFAREVQCRNGLPVRG